MFASPAGYMSTSSGRIHDLICDTAAIFFSSWRPHFDSKAQNAEESLDHPVWVQIVDLCQVLREESFLKIIGEQIGQVISIDNSEAYRSKLFGPRIRLLVGELHRLPPASTDGCDSTPGRRGYGGV